MPKAMFGGAGYFVNDNIFAGVHGGDMVIRLPHADREALLSSWSEASQFEPMPGRPMREHVVLPPSLYEDSTALETWLDKSYRFAASLPPKPPKAKKKY